MKSKTARSLIAAAMLTSLLSVSNMAVQAWTPGEQIGTDTEVPYDSNFSGYSGPNQGNLINWGGGTKVTVTGSNDDTAAFKDNTGVSDAGGALYNGWGGETVIQSASKFENNTSNRGGAVWNNGKLNFLNKATFTKNTATTTAPSKDYAGGAIVNSHFGDDADSGVMTFQKGVEFKENNAVQGGAVKQGGTINVTGGALFENNHATNGNGGAVYNAAGWGEDSIIRKETYDTLTAKENTATGAGGAYYIDDNKGSLEVTGKADFQKNEAGTYGGAIYNDGGTVSVGSGSKFNENKAVSETTATAGGAIYNIGNGNVTIGKSSAFTKNKSGSDGGGAIYNEASLIIKGGSIFQNNNTTGDGGAIFNAGSLVLDTKDGNISFSGNTANGSQKNDIYLSTGSSMTVSGGGTVTLGSGLITEGSPALALFSLGSSSDPSDLNITEGTELVLSGASTVAGNVTFSGDSKLTNNAKTTISGNIGVDPANSGNASILNDTKGNLTISGTSSEVDLTNNGTATVSGTVSNANVTNNKTMTVSGTATSVTVVNNDNMTVSGTINSSTVTNDKNLTINNSTSTTVVNNDSLTINGTTSSMTLTNNAQTTVNGTLSGTITQKDDASILTVANGATLSADGETIDGGSLIFVGNGGLASGTVLNVTDAVNLQLASTTIDGNGLAVGDGHIKSTTGMNLIGSDYTVSGDILKTSVIITGSTINAQTGDTLEIASGNTLTLSNDKNGTVSDDAFLVDSGAVLKLAPTSGNSLNLSAANKISGAGDVLVDEIVETVYDLNDDGSYTSRVEHKGVGNINIASENDGFTGKFTQKMGSIVQKAGSFFGGTNVIENGSTTIAGGATLNASSTTVKNGTLNLQNGAIVSKGTASKPNTVTVTTTTDVSGKVTGYGTLNIYNNLADSATIDRENYIFPVDDEDNDIAFNAIISADEIGNGYDSVLTYLNDDSIAPTDPSDPTTGTPATTQDININDGAGLGLFNGTLIDGNLTLYSDKGVRDLTLGSGSGINADKINLGEDTKLTYLDDAYIRDNSDVSMDQGTKLTFNYSDKNTSVDYTSVISSVDTSDSEYTSLIHKKGVGKLSILSSLKDYHGSVKVDGGGVLNLDNEDSIELNNLSVNNSEFYSASKTINATGNVTVENNAIVNADGDLIVSGDTKVTDSIANVAGDISSKNITLKNSTVYADANVTAGQKLSVFGGALDVHDDVLANDAVMSDTTVNVGGDFKTTNSAALNNTNFTVFGDAEFGDTSVGGTSVINLKNGAVLNSLALQGTSVINSPADISIANAMTIGAAGGTDNPTIDLLSGGINNITAGSVVLNTNSNIKIDVDPRSKATDSIDAASVTSPSGAKLLISGINITQTPIDRKIDIEISKVLTQSGVSTGLVGIADGKVTAKTEMGTYLLTSSSSSSIVQAQLVELNPQMYRGQVATSAAYANQLVVNNILLDHTNILANDLIARDRNANRFAAANPVFAPYQYSKKDGDLWYKAYGNFERITMTQGLHVGNNAYGSLIGADFPLIELGNGWNIVPTGYIAYNGGHQHFSGVSMYQDGAQVGAMASAYKGDFITSLLAYGGGYHNHMSVHGPIGYGSDDTGNWFAGVASKTAYNIHLPADFIFQPTGLISYNIFGNQNYHSNFGNMSMNSGFLNGINVAPGMNLIWNKKTFSLYGTAQLVFNIMGDVSGKAGNVDLEDVRMKTTYFEYGLGAMKRFKDTFSAYLQFTIRNGYRTGIGFQGGLQWKVGREKMGAKSKNK